MERVKLRERKVDEKRENKIDGKYFFLKREMTHL